MLCFIDYNVVHEAQHPTLHTFCTQCIFARKFVGTPCTAKIKQSQKELRIATNGSGKKLEWWEKVFNHLDNRDRVCFGLDGLQDTAHLYRINTDFFQVFDRVV